MAKKLIIGVGNRDRGDDALGLIAIDKLRDNPPEDTALFQCNGDMGTLMEAWKGYAQVIIIDACQSGGEPGTLQTFDASSSPLPATFSNTSTHGLGLAEAVEMARRLGTLPKDLKVFAIEGEGFEIGGGLTPRVKKSLKALPFY